MTKSDSERVREWCRRNPERWREINRRSYEKNKWKGPAKRFNASFFVRTARLRSAANGLDFDLTESWAESAFTGRCEMTGLVFQMPDGLRRYAGPYSISLDRIDQKRGYTQDNCRFVLWAVNRFRGADGDDAILRIAQAMLENRGYVIEPPKGIRSRKGEQ